MTSIKEAAAREQATQEEMISCHWWELVSRDTMDILNAGKVSVKRAPARHPFLGTRFQQSEKVGDGFFVLGCQGVLNSQLVTRQADNTIQTLTEGYVTFSTRDHQTMRVYLASFDAPVTQGTIQFEIETSRTQKRKGFAFSS